LANVNKASVVQGIGIRKINHHLIGQSMIVSATTPSTPG
jgi:hypothetical protein